MDHLHGIGACRGCPVPVVGIHHLARRRVYVRPAPPARAGRTGSDQLPPSDRDPGEPLTLADLFTFEV